MRNMLQYLKYCFTSKYRHGFGIHSPYVYRLVTNVIEENLPYYKYSLIEGIREKMAHVDEKIGLIEADGGKKLYSVKRLVKDYSVSPKYGQLLFRLVNHFKPTSIVEYGATCGISTMYMAAPCGKTPVFALTRQSEMADLAKTFEERVEMRNVKHFAVKDLPEAYEGLLGRLQQRDFLFVNQAEPQEVREVVGRRLEKGGSFAIAITRPYASAAMWEVWKQLKADPAVSVAINIYQLGLLIADGGLQKGDYVLRY